MMDLSRRLFAEGFGTMMLVATVVGSGIMAERLAGGNVALALLGNTIATGAILVVLISILGPVSGAHFNPRRVFCFCIAPHDCSAYSRFVCALANHWRAVWHGFGTSDV